MAASKKITFNFTVTLAIAAAVDELSLIEDVERGEMLRDLLHIGIEEKLSEHPVLFEAYQKARLPVKRKPKRGTLYRLKPTEKPE